MKIDTYHAKIESIHNSYDEGWYDSNSCDSIQSKSERFYDTIQAKVESIQIQKDDFWLSFMHVNNAQDTKDSKDIMKHSC